MTTPVAPTVDSITGLSVNLVGQAAAIASTALFAVPFITQFGQPIPFAEQLKNFLWQVVWSAIITTAATTSCVLGGAAGFQLSWTDNDTAAVTTPAAIPLITSSVNVVGTQINGTFIVNPTLGSTVSYLFGYTSVGATAMQYALKIRVMPVGI